MRRTSAAGIVGGGVALAVAAIIAAGGEDDPARGPTPPPPPSGPLIPGGSEAPRGGGLHVVGVDGRGLRRVTRSEEAIPLSAAWSPDGRRIAVNVTVPSEQPLPRARPAAGIEVLDLRGRLVRRFEAPAPSSNQALAPSLSSPAWSPDSRRLTYVVSDPNLTARGVGAGEIGGLPLIVANIASGRTRVVSRRARSHGQGRPDWSPDGRLIAFGSLYSGGPMPGAPAEINAVVPLPEISVVGPDGRGERRVTRDPKRFRQPAGSDEETDALWLSDRELFYVSLITPPNPAASRRLRVIGARGGRPRDLTGINYAIPAASPDGRRVALTGSTPEAPRLRLYALDVESGRLTTLVSENVVERPTWSPDGKRIAFALGDRIETIRPDGSGRRTLVRLPGEEIREVAWSPDGRRIAFTTTATQRVPTPPGPPVDAPPSP